MTLYMGIFSRGVGSGDDMHRTMGYIHILHNQEYTYGTMLVNCCCSTATFGIEQQEQCN